MPVETITDPIASVVVLLKPRPSVSKMVAASGRWRVERTNLASPFYAAIVEGRCQLIITGHAPVMLTAGDFVLIPDLHSFTMHSEVPPPPGAARTPLETGPGTFRIGPADAPVQMRALVGHCSFASPERQFLLTLLPDMIHLSGHDRIMALVPIIHEETRADRPARGMVLERLLEVLMIEALRSSPGPNRPPGLLRGLSDSQLAIALHRIHADTAGALSVATLAQHAGMSRSTFYARFQTALGCPPMEYVTAWRMAVARDLLLRGRLTNSEIAEQVGYGSASAFGMAFVRHQGVSPRIFVERITKVEAPSRQHA
ncbi:helix-turn-helix transcriptional regulator [Paracoccus benzoatiresistens]|uniref:AraC family transcriptional regulator n=1 Tax=Paracoccus benzoatiresistens TaxID=2997341 RepID=A0ABT4JAP5_9RHOB|nr:AraC family transcriptional regulator [Paracoccus sp. EF6]MCZ0963785.1 AraC family transcriptional regulator [Paracoccus sp. EF6]